MKGKNKKGNKKGSKTKLNFDFKSLPNNKLGNQDKIQKKSADGRHAIYGDIIIHFRRKGTLSNCFYNDIKVDGKDSNNWRICPNSFDQIDRIVRIFTNVQIGVNVNININDIVVSNVEVLKYEYSGAHVNSIREKIKTIGNGDIEKTGSEEGVLLSNISNDNDAQSFIDAMNDIIKNLPKDNAGKPITNCSKFGEGDRFAVVNSNNLEIYDDNTKQSYRVIFKNENGWHCTGIYPVN